MKAGDDVSPSDASPSSSSPSSPSSPAARDCRSARVIGARVGGKDRVGSADGTWVRTMRRMRSMTTVALGTSSMPLRLPVATPSMRSTTSMPSTTVPKAQYPSRPMPGSSEPLSTVLMKNWDVALSGSPVRAIAIVPLSLSRPRSASSGMGSFVGCFSYWRS